MADRKYGWRPDLPDTRDYKYAAPARILRALPPSVDLRPGCPPIQNQGSLGSCTANAIGAAHQFGQRLQGAVNEIVPSRLFIYYCEREMEGTISYDAGAYIRDGMKCVADRGVCHEPDWPYDPDKFAQRPPVPCFTDAQIHQVTSYWSVRQNLEQLKACLADGYPIVFGFTVYDSFESEYVAQHGDAPMPGESDSVVGGHAVLCVGYDDATQRFLVRNSWGTTWGKDGYFTLPYEYLTNPDLSADFWTIRMVEVDNEEPAPQPDPQPDPGPGPEPSSPCNMPGALPVVKAFVDGTMGHIKTVRGVNVTPDLAGMMEAGFRGLQNYLERLQKVQDRRSK